MMLNSFNLRIRIANKSHVKPVIVCKVPCIYSPFNYIAMNKKAILFLFKQINTNFNEDEPQTRIRSLKVADKQVNERRTVERSSETDLSHLE